MKTYTDEQIAEVVAILEMAKEISVLISHQKESIAKALTTLAAPQDTNAIRDAILEEAASIIDGLYPTIAYKALSTPLQISCASISRKIRALKTKENNHEV